MNNLALRPDPQRLAWTHIGHCIQTQIPISLPGPISHVIRIAYVRVTGSQQPASIQWIQCHRRKVYLRMNSRRTPRHSAILGISERVTLALWMLVIASRDHSVAGPVKRD